MTNPNRILVVEDNDFVRMQIVKFLNDTEEAAFEVLEASGGEQAIAMMDEDGGIDMAIVDIRMEPIDGFEFVKHIRSEGNKVPVILVTGDQNPDLLSEAGKWGVAAVLMKPVQRDRLIATVIRTLKTLARAS